MSILALTSDTLIGTPATGNLEYNGQFFGTDSNASRAQLQRIVRATAVASTSGTAINFTDIPAWVERITVMFSGVSTNGTSAYLIQIGSGSVTNTGYTSSTLAVQASASSSAGTTSTAGFVVISANVASYIYSGIVTITNITGNTWVSSGNLIDTSGVRGSLSSGAVSLSGTLDRVRLTTVNGTDTFDAGTVNIMYEG